MPAVPHVPQPDVRPRRSGLLALAALAVPLALLLATAGCPSDSCRLGTAGCECTALRTCEAGASCFQRWCWGGEHPTPDSYYYTPKNLEDTQAVRLAVKAALELEAGQIVADIGCGQGYLSRAAGEAVGAGGRVIATDLDAAALDHTRRYLARAHDPRALGALTTVHVTDPRETGLEREPDGTVDLILVINSALFETRLDDRQDVAYLGELKRKLRPGGRLIYHRDWLDFDDLDRSQVVNLMARAGLELAPEIPMPAGIPETTFYRPAGPRGPHIELRRGYILVARCPAG